MGCDDNALQRLYTLAQHSEEGRRSAVSIVGKMLRRNDLRNPSGWLDKSCGREFWRLHEP